MADRVIEKIEIKITIDKPDPMPLMLHEEVGKGTEGDKKISVSRNPSGNLLLVYVDDRGYVVDVRQIVKGILAHENQVKS